MSKPTGTTTKPKAYGRGVERVSDEQIVNAHFIHTKYKIPVRVLAHLLGVTEPTLFQRMDKKGLERLSVTELRREYGSYVGDPEARLMKYLVDFGVSTEKISQVSGRVRTTVREAIRRIESKEVE